MSNKRLRQGTDIVAQFLDHFGRATKLLKNCSDEEAMRMLGGGALNEFLQAVLTPWPAVKDVKPYEYFLRNKNRCAIIAGTRIACQRNYVVKAVLDDGQTVFLSPLDKISRHGGVFFLQGYKPYEGMIAKYSSETVTFGLAARAIGKGESLDLDADLVFVTVEEARARSVKYVTKPADELNQAIQDLWGLLNSHCNEEAKYQSLLRNNPWMFGGEYGSIEPHERFDDRTIPDFTGVRVRDLTRDIIEIKAPFLDLFRQDGTPSTAFHEAWFQAERYLTFAREHQEYLRLEKNLVFENPCCVLVIGYSLSAEQRKQVRAKEKLNPAIKVFTYHDLLTFARSTVDFLGGLADRLKPEDGKPKTGDFEAKDLGQGDGVAVQAG